MHLFARRKLSHQVGEQFKKERQRIMRTWKIIEQPTYEPPIRINIV